MSISTYRLYRPRRLVWLLLGLAAVLCGVLVIVLSSRSSQQPLIINPLQGATLYRDTNRPIVELANTYRNSGRVTEANDIDVIASQPNTTWLTGPSIADPTAGRDIELLTRTSAEANAEGRLPVYELYAIPRRDACAGYSAAGFQTDKEYLQWIDRLVAALKGPAVFSVEADAIAQTVNGSCLNDSQVAARYALLEQAVGKLSNAPFRTTIYIDAGHPEWFPDPKVLVEPLRASGIDKARGIAVNVSFYEATDTSVRWAQRLVDMLGDDKGAIIDTSRNGQGAPPRQVTGEARWCNAVNRGLGKKPTVSTNQAKIDAYLWIKNPGESDGSCFGNAAAGALVPQLALDLVKNAKF